MRMTIGLLATLLAGSALAQPPDDATLDRMLTAAHTDRIIAATYKNFEDSMRTGILNSLGGRSLTPAQQKIFDTLPARLGTILREEASWEKIRPVIMQAYRDSFTQEDVEGILRFYESPAGRAYVEKLPAVIARTNALMTDVMQAAAKRSSAAMQDFIAELKAAGDTPQH